jgi:hypothetical protein
MWKLERENLSSSSKQPKWKLTIRLVARDPRFRLLSKLPDPFFLRQNSRQKERESNEFSSLLINLILFRSRDPQLWARRFVCWFNCFEFIAMEEKILFTCAWSGSPRNPSQRFLISFSSSTGTIAPDFRRLALNIYAAKAFHLLDLLSKLEMSQRKLKFSAPSRLTCQDESDCEPITGDCLDKERERRKKNAKAGDKCHYRPIKIRNRASDLLLDIKNQPWAQM